MAALTFTQQLDNRLTVGNRVIVVGRFTITNADAADEWVDTTLNEVEAVLGVVPIGQAQIAAWPVFRKNAQGTGNAEGSSFGDLAVEGDAGVYEVTVLGKV